MIEFTEPDYGGRELRHVSVATGMVQAGPVQRDRRADLRVDMRSAGSELRRVIAFAQAMRTVRIAAIARS